MLTGMKRSYFIKLVWLMIVLCVAHPALAQVSDGTLRRMTVPILMYHYVSPLPDDADDIRRDLTIEPAVFAQHMQYLADAGYATISLYDLYDAMLFGATLPAKPIILTFDDGYVDHYEMVFPVLQRHDFTGTFFVITGRADAGDPVYLNWAQIVEMAAADMSMEAHTRSHASLYGRERDFLVYELLGSRESLTAHTGDDSWMLAYPAGHYDETTIDVAEALDFKLALTTEQGMAHVTSNRLTLPRLRVNGDTGVAGLAYILSGRWQG